MTSCCEICFFDFLIYYTCCLIGWKIIFMKWLSLGMWDTKLLSPEGVNELPCKSREFTLSSVIRTDLIWTRMFNQNLLYGSFWDTISQSTLGNVKRWHVNNVCVKGVCFTKRCVCVCRALCLLIKPVSGVLTLAKAYSVIIRCKF